MKNEQVREFSCLLVTGGCGFIGSAFVRALFASLGFTGKVVNFDLLTYAGNPENLTAHVDESRYHFVKGDICDQATLLQVVRDHGVDGIVNFAAESHVDRSIVAPGRFINTNIVGTFQLLELLRA